MSDRPILFSAPMIRALLEGRKTQTRRVLKKPVPPADADRIFTWFPPVDVPVEGIPNQWAPGGLWADQNREGEPGEPGYKGGYKRHVGFLPYRPGDRLWVREAWAPLDSLTHNDPGVQALADRGFYRADCSTVDGEISRWSPSIFMPRWASRLTLIVTDVRVQRLQAISEQDAKAEGCPGTLGPNPDFPDEWDPSPREEFQSLWDSLNKKRGFGWDVNPWLVAVSFEVTKGNIDRIGEGLA